MPHRDSTDLDALWALPPGTRVTLRGPFGARSGRIVGFDPDALVLRDHEDYLTTWRDEIQSWSEHASDSEHATHAAAPPTPLAVAPSGPPAPPAPLQGWSRRRYQFGGAGTALVSLVLGPGALLGLVAAIGLMFVGGKQKEFAKGMLTVYAIIVAVFGACLAIILR